MHVLENMFIKKWKEQMINNLKIIYPYIKESELNNLLDHLVVNNIKDIDLIIKNTYMRKERQTSLLSVLDWFYRENQILCANGSFYKRQDIETSPQTEMIKYKMDERKIFKNKMLECISKGDSKGEKDNNLAQTNVKIEINSSYGEMGQSKSFSYNVATAGAITGQGRSIISATMWTIEYFVGNNIYFENFDDIYIYITNILNEPDNPELDNLITYFPEDKVIIKYLISKLIDRKNIKKNAAMLTIMFKKLSTHKKAKIYYKNNLYKLLENNNQIYNIISTMLNIPNTSFIDPYKPPTEYIPLLDSLTVVLKYFVYYNKIIYNKVEKYVGYRREVVIGSDTDSVFINLDPWVYLNCDLYEKYNNINILYNQDMAFKIINIITKVLYLLIHDIYNILCNAVHIPNEYKKFISIKNEYLFDRFILYANQKKNYIYRQRLKEGKLLPKPKVHATGILLNSPSKNKVMSARIKDLVQNVLINSEKIKPEELLKSILDLNKEIITSLQSGETKYGIPCKIKHPSEYKERTNEQGENVGQYVIQKFRGLEVYRITSLDNTYNLPISAHLFHLNIQKIEDLTWVKDNYPEIYERIRIGVFQDKNLSKYGINAICLPLHLEKLPDWVIPYIDYENLCRIHLSPLIALLPSVGLRVDSIGSTSKYYSTVLDI